MLPIEKIASIVGVYAILFVTGFPFLFFVISAISRIWRNDARQRRLLLINAAIYPILFVLVWFALVKTFGVREEFASEASRIDIAAEKNILAGDPPERNNAALGAVFLGGMYFLGTLVPTTLVGFAYSLTSSFFILRPSSKKRWWMPFATALFLSSVLIYLAYVFRTPIFNLVGLR